MSILGKVFFVLLRSIQGWHHCCSFCSQLVTINDEFREHQDSRLNVFAAAAAAKWNLVFKAIFFSPECVIQNFRPRHFLAENLVQPSEGCFLTMTTKLELIFNNPSLRSLMTLLTLIVRCIINLNHFKLLAIVHSITNALKISTLGSNSSSSEHLQEWINQRTKN